VAIGGVAILFGLLNLLLPLAGEWVPGAAGKWRAALAGALTYGLIGGAFIWAGVGSIRHRRWVRSVMLVLAWSWLLCGILIVPAMALLLGDMIAVSGPGGETVPAEAIWLITAIFVGAGGLFGIALPALFVWAYRDPNVTATCRAHDPLPAWTDRCPSTVMGLSLGLAIAAIISLPMALQPIVPFFGYLVTGIPAVILILIGAAACGWLARATYLQKSSGWWSSLLFLTGIGVSTTVTLARIQPAEWMLAMGYPEEMTDLVSDGAVRAGVWVSAAITVVSVVYLLAIRRYFTQPRSGR